MTYNSADVIEDCLSSLKSSDHQELKIVLVDNCSPDETVNSIRNFDRGDLTYQEVSSEQAAQANSSDQFDITLIASQQNTGFAGGVNQGLVYLLNDPGIDLFWVLNPDVMVAPDTAKQYALRAKEVGEFGLMGGRILYVSPANVIQTDGGMINPRTGICSGIHAGMPATTPPPKYATGQDFVPGASIVTSRQFLETVGLMDEDYFLYYEEVDWAFRRGQLKLIHAPKAVVRHHGGTAIGSASIDRKQGSALSNYFNYRNRMRFMRKYYARNRWTAYLYSSLKIIKFFGQGHLAEADGALRGLFDLPPPKKVRQCFSEDVGQIAFGD